MAVQDPSRGASFIDTRHVGEATVTAVSEGGLLWPPRFPVSEPEWRQAMPEADADGRVWLGLNVVIIRLGEALIVVDPGMDDPDSAWQRERPLVWPDWEVTTHAGSGRGVGRTGARSGGCHPRRHYPSP